MTFKAIITHDSSEGDEHTYYGVVFADKDFSQPKKLTFNSSLNRLEATFSFDDGKVKVGHYFLAILVPVNKSEITKTPPTTPQWKIEKNDEKPVPVIVHFP
jgi:hypothetical protein